MKSEKKVSEAINYRRSIRHYDPDLEIDEKIVKQCIEQATLAPNSSNLQLWQFYHVINKKIIDELSKSCFNQPAARTSKQLIVVVIRKDLWRKRANANADFIKSTSLNKSEDFKRRNKMAINYYKKLIPAIYSDFFGIFGFLRYIIAFITGLFRPIYRQVRKSDLRVVAHKSSALAAENFMISMAAKGYDTCPMEGFDSLRVKKILKLPSSSEINMIISCGIRSKKGVYGPRFRIPFNEIYFRK